MSKFGFVILHYQTIDDTISCVNSILEYLVEEDICIVIVDNASPNKSGKMLQQKYENTANIHVLINDTNTGYARGNNVGYTYAQKELACDYIILLNNDTLMIQKEFCKIIEQEYLSSHCAAIGPLILKNGVETLDNPGRSKPFNIHLLFLFIWMNRLLLILSYLQLDIYPNKIFDIYVSVKKRKQPESVGDRWDNVALHGCCLAFTPLFVRNEEGLDPNTFMYMEEDLLYEKLQHQHMNMVYLPRLRIEHKEAGCTSQIFNNNRRKRQFVYRNTIKSAKILYQYKKDLKGQPDTSHDLFWEKDNGKYTK